MSTWPIPSALDAGTQTFPILKQAQIDRILPFGRVRAVAPGDILFEPGDTEVPFFVLLSGAMEIVQPSMHGERPIATHSAGAFTGEITMITGGACLVTGRVTEAGEFLELPSADFRTLIGRDAELSEICMRAFILRRVALISGGLGNAIVLGSRHSADTLRIREFLGRNGYPHQYMDLDADQEAQATLDEFHVTPADIPVVICYGKQVLRNPSAQELAQCLGLNANIDREQVRDVVIVGAGPSGLAAAVYAASEGLDTLIIETGSPGGQAGSSSKIENYLGFPTGVSGQELASRATTQAQKFGARMIVARSVVRLDCGKRPFELVLDDGSTIASRTIVISTGASYNKPNLPKLQSFEGRGIYYGATYIESQLCQDEEVIVVGGGNSAGQAAVYLSQYARKVYMLVRSGGLADTMSRYLIQRITENPKIELRCKTEIVALEGEEQLEQVTWTDKASDTISTHDIRHVFMMTGASPRTSWLQGCIALDEKGFILTGRDIEEHAAGPFSAWNRERAPQMLETSLPGVFAVGDVRANNVKRVASAVGEGAIAIHMVHRTLSEL